MIYHSVQIKLLHPDASIPLYWSEDAAACDILAVEDTWLYPGIATKIKTGIAIALPRGWKAELSCRSSNDTWWMPNSPGIIDADYRGEIKIKACLIWRSLTDSYRVIAGSRIAQMCIVPADRCRFQVTDTLPDSVRGSGGFGSTGK